nr:biotin--[acetyl-CoA-carboxylase] ligase [Kineococcus siccus]
MDVVATTGSTNADLLARADAVDGTVLVADHQSGGRGRLGRRWEAPARSSLAVSVLLRPAVPRERWSWLPLLTGLAVADALDGLGVDVALKWPNDVLVRLVDAPAASPDGKVAGILVEAREDVVVLGAGVNVSQRAGELPPAAASADGPGPSAPPTSLALAGATSTDRDTVLRRYLRALRERLDAFAAAFAAAGGDPEAAGTAAAYRAVCSTLGAQVRAHLPDGRVLEGLAEDVDASGRLVLRPDGSGSSAGGGGPRTSLSAADVVHLRRA